MKITFIGLGNMGGPMAANLARAGYDLTVCDLDPAKATALQSLGATFVESPEKAVQHADIVMTSLPGPKQIEAMAGPTMLEAMKPGSVWIELSTNNLEVERSIRAMAAGQGVEMLDAPVSGGTEGAANGTLTIMVGGDRRQCDPSG